MRKIEIKYDLHVLRSISERKCIVEGTVTFDDFLDFLDKEYTKGVVRIENIRIAVVHEVTK